jgi:hypothetical protein
VISATKVFAIVFQGNSRAALPREAAHRLSFSAAAQAFLARRAHAFAVSPAANLHQVKARTLRCVSCVCIDAKDRCMRNFLHAKTKEPGGAGLFDEYLFRSVHFASFAI